MVTSNASGYWRTLPQSASTSLPHQQQGSGCGSPSSPSILVFVVDVIAIVLEGVGRVVVHLASLS